MKREYQSGYRKLYADKAFRQRLVRHLEDYRANPTPARPHWMAPAAVAACLILLFGLGLPTMQRVLNQAGTTSGLSAAGDEGVTITDGVYRDSRVTNLLVLGTDSENGYDDCVLLVSLDRRRGVLKCSNFRGDLTVTLPEGGEQRLSRLSKKIASPEQAAATVEKNFGVGVDGYVQINMENLPRIIDAVGGVTMELSSEEAMYFALSSRMEIGLSGLDAGTYQLSGEQALYYLRMRQGEAHERMRRREKLFQSLAEQAKDQDLADLANIVLSVAETNFTVAETTGLLLELPAYLDAPVQSLLLPEAEDVSLKACGQALAKFLYEVVPDNSGAYVAPAAPTEAGNAPGNLANGGIAAQGDGCVYYLDYSDGGKIYMLNPDDKVRTALTQFPCSALNVQDGYLYFISQYDGGVYRMDGLGGNLIPVAVTKDVNENLTVTPEYLYYSRGNLVYRMETGVVETSVKRNVVPEELVLELGGGSLVDLQWSNGSLYIFMKEPKSPRQIQVYQVAGDGGMDFVCAFNRAMDGSSFFHWDGAALYFTNEDGLSRWENGETIQIAAAPITGMLAVNQTVYWQETSGALYRAEWNGKELANREELFTTSEILSRFCVAGENLFYTNAGKYITWRLDLEETEKSAEIMGPFKSVGNSLGYPENDGTERFNRTENAAGTSSVMAADGWTMVS